MTLQISYLCPNCSNYIEWLYDEDEEEILPFGNSGCVGSSCRIVHCLTIREPSEKTEQHLRDQFDHNLSNGT